MIRAHFIGFCLALVLLPAIGFGQGIIRLEPDRHSIAPGETVSIDIVGENIPPVYGMEMALEYSAETLELIDADPETEGTQIHPGDFFNPDGPIYPLQNGAFSRSGKILYATSLLNPAPEAKGNGRLARVEMTARKAGPVTLQVKNVLFGTRDGQGIRPAGDMKLSLVAKEPMPPAVWWMGVGAALAMAASFARFLRGRKTAAAGA